MELVLDSERIRAACNPFANEGWKHASQMSVGRDGILCAEAFAGRGAVEAWARKLTTVLKGQVDREELALKVKRISKRAPWKNKQGCSWRDVAIGGILGRCLAIHLGGVLRETVEPLLPSCAIAYRTGRSAMVERAVLRVAHAIGMDDYRYYAKLDIADCFNSMPRSAVRRSLLSMGFPEEFVQLVMLSVGAPRYRQRQGSWVRQSSEKGCPAGLPESSTLVNVLFLEFDRWAQRHCSGLVYFRYCDDFLFVGRTRADVERAVAELLRVTHELGLTLKDVSPKQSPASLVHDVRQQALVFLGSEIAADGNVHIPSGALNAEFAKIRYRMAQAARVGHLVAARSRYAARGRRSRGVLTFDGDDLLATVTAFYRRWFTLNRGEAKAFLARADTEFNLNPRTRRAPYRKLWIAALGSTESLVGGGAIADQDATSDPLEAWVRRDVFPLMREVLQGVASETPWDLLDELDALAGRGTSDLSSEGTHKRDFEAQGRLVDTTSAKTLGSCTDGVEDEGAKEPNGLAIGALGLERAPRGAAPCCKTSGATTMGPPVPPGRPLSLPIRLVFVRHRYDPTANATTVWSDEFSDGGRPLGTFEMVYAEQQPTTAVLDHLLQRASQIRGARLVFAMEQAMLAKHLLRDGLEFRSVAVIQRVWHLHAVAPTAVVMGPIRFPGDIPIEDCEDRGRAEREFDSSV
jgi:hypothetical protein